MIYLASQSEIRCQLLTNAGVHFSSLASPLDEEAEKQKYLNFTPPQLAQHLAIAKAKALSSLHPQSLVIGADQTLEHENTIIHKATSVAEATHTLSKLSGQKHQLHTAVAITRGSDVVFKYLSTTTLKMRELSPHFIATYLHNLGNNAFTSPGAYQIEKTGAQLFADISGDHFAVLGLPLLPILAFLQEIGELPS